MSQKDSSEINWISGDIIDTYNWQNVSTQSND